jgi:hypothetical protein
MEIVIYALGLATEVRLGTEQTSVMLQIMHTDFETLLSQPQTEIWTYGPFGNEVKAGSEAQVLLALG